MPEQDMSSEALMGELQTLRKRVAELEAAASGYRRVQSFYEAGIEGIAIHDSGRVIDVNPQFCAMFGYTREELIDSDGLDLIVPEHRAIVRKHIMAGDETPYEVDGLRKNGSRFPSDISGRQITLQDRSFRVAVFRDVTERRKTELGLRASERRFRSIAESSPMGIYLYDLTDDDRLILTQCNHAAETITDVPADSIIGKTIEEAFPPLANTDIPDHYRRTAQTGEPWFSEEISYQDDHIVGAYEVYACQASANQALVMFNDITYRKQAERERKDLEAQVQHVQKLESLGVLAGGIAHDFNNLLMGMLGNADLALAELPPLSPARPNIEGIRTAAGRAADLCKQMLAYSGKGKFVIEGLNLSEVVKEMAHMLEVSISKKAVLKYNVSENLPTILADVTQIRQVVMNLITNASEAIGERSGIISITTGAMECDRKYLTETYLDESLPEGLYITLEVSDTGRGMDLDTQKRLFEPFFTTKFTGRGLGLAAVLGIVRGHKGAIRVYSEIGRGTTFKLLFPAVDRKVAHDAPAPSTPWKGSGRILLADDEETVRTVGKRMLEHVGFEVLTASDGGEAVDLFRDQHDQIACVILDLTMPHMDGEEAFREMRRIDPGVRVIMSSGYNEQEVTQRFVGKGLAGFIQKPYRLDTLAEKVRAILGE